MDKNLISLFPFDAAMRERVIDQRGGVVSIDVNQQRVHVKFSDNQKLSITHSGFAELAEILENRLVYRSARNFEVEDIIKFIKTPQKEKTLKELTTIVLFNKRVRENLIRSLNNPICKKKPTRISEYALEKLGFEEVAISEEDYYHELLIKNWRIKGERCEDDLMRLEAVNDSVCIEIHDLKELEQLIKMIGR